MHVVCLNDSHIARWRDARDVSMTSAGARQAGKYRFSAKYLIVAAAKEAGLVFSKLTRAEIIALFSFEYVSREAERLKSESLQSEGKKMKLVNKVFTMCGELAWKMFAAEAGSGVTSVEAPADEGAAEAVESDDEDDPAFAHMKASRNAEVKADEQKAAAGKSAARRDLEAYFKNMLSGEDESSKCSPLRRTNRTYQFLHKTVQEFFAAHFLARQLVNLMLSDPSGWRASLGRGLVTFKRTWGKKKGEQSVVTDELALSEKLLTADPAVLRMACDMIDSATVGALFHYAPPVDRNESVTRTDRAAEHHPFGASLLEIVYAARRGDASPSLVCAAANAASVLNNAHVAFSGRDLRGLTLGHDELKSGAPKPGLRCVG